MSEEQRIREAVQASVDAESDEDRGLVTKWALVAEVAMPGGGRYLMHRAGDVNDEGPMMWDVLGMLEGSLVAARDQMSEYMRAPERPDDESE